MNLVFAINLDLFFGNFMPTLCNIMKKGITLIFFLVMVLSCKQKQTEKYISTENKSEIVEVEKSVTKKITENKVKNVVSKKRPDCESKTLVAINSLIEKGADLNNQNFAQFFADMNPDCSNNAEYIEFNNELIFKTLESNPKKFIVFLSRVSKKKKILGFVLTQLRNPIHDGIELNGIYKQLNETKIENSKTKKLVLESIKKAIEKYN